MVVVGVIIVMRVVVCLVEVVRVAGFEVAVEVVVGLKV